MEHEATRLSTINDYAKGGLKMIDPDYMIKSSRLAWATKDIKRYFSHLLA